MPRPPINLNQKVREILAHVDPLPPEADTPLAHFNRSGTDLWNLLLYVERNFGQLSLQAAAVRRHMSRLHGMILVNLVETFERFLKETAAACVNHLAARRPFQRPTGSSTRNAPVAGPTVREGLMPRPGEASPPNGRPG
ncbi:MAG: hypothetical protein U0797_13645 [Gemmataceae bacterium]